MKALATIAATLFAAASVVGCASAPMQSIFYADEVAFIHERGTNTIKGNAFLRQQGGDVVSCAGSEVLLIPKGSYSTERMKKLFGTASAKGFKEKPTVRFRRELKAVDGYWHALKRTTCDIDGKFEFRNVAAGSYFIVTSVTWTTYIPTKNLGNWPDVQGGRMMAPVIFAFSEGDEVRNVVLTW